MKPKHCKNGDGGCMWDKDTKTCYYPGEPTTTPGPESCEELSGKQCKGEEGEALMCEWDKETKTCNEIEMGCATLNKKNCQAVTGEDGYFCSWDKTTKECMDIDDPCASKTKKSKCNKNASCTWDKDADPQCYTDFSKTTSAPVDCGSLEMQDCKDANECQWKASKDKCKDA